VRSLVLGRGKSGTAAAKELERRGSSVAFADNVDLVVASPGVRVVSELQFGCEELKRRGWKLLAVTGSKGKSSVVKVVAEALVLAGQRAIPCGNYGRPVCDLISEEPGWAVVEVSSFQLETTTLAADTFEAAVVLNLQEDHLDRHGSLSVYHALKLKLLTFAALAYGPGEAPPAKSFIAGSYFDNEILRDNGSAAVALMRAAGLSDDQIRSAFVAFVPLPHRMNLVFERKGVRYFDDSKATSLAALEAGVKMAGSSVRLIAGGLPKGDDPRAVRPTLTERVKKVYLIGQSAQRFCSAWSDVVDCEVCETLERAVQSVCREAEKGDCVLLSPGAASFDQFHSFEERGDVFASLVQKGGCE